MNVRFLYCATFNHEIMNQRRSVHNSSALLNDTSVVCIPQLLISIAHAKIHAHLLLLVALELMV